MKNQKVRKIIILILSSDKYPSPRNEQIQFETWVQRASDFNAEVFFYKGGEKFSENKNYISFPVGDEIKDIGAKTLEAFKWIEERFEYDFVLRANSSCFVNLNKLDEFFSNQDNSKPIYAGHMNNYNNKFNYVQGVGILLNRKSVQIILDHETNWDHSLIDDVALGKIAHENLFEQHPIDTLFVDGKILNGILDQNLIIYRCKMENFGYPRYLDRYFLKIIDDIFTKKINNNTLKLKKIIFNIIKIFNFKFYKLKYSNKIYYKITSLIPKNIKNIIKKFLNF